MAFGAGIPLLFHPPFERFKYMMIINIIIIMVVIIFIIIIIIIIVIIITIIIIVIIMLWRYDTAICLKYYLYIYVTYMTEYRWCANYNDGPSVWETWQHWHNWFNSLNNATMS